MDLQKNSNPRVRVVVADDDPLILGQVVSLLETRFEVIGRAVNGRELVDIVQRLSPEVVVADITMPEMNGIEAARQISKTCRNVKVVMLSGYSDDTLIAGALAAGAAAYVAKLKAFTELIPAIQGLLAAG